MKLQPTHSDTLPARYLPYRRYPDSYPCLSRVPLERSFAVVLDPTPGSDNNLPADPLPAPSDEGSPMRSIRDTPSVRRTPSMDSENSVRGYLMEGVESVEPMASAHTSYVQVTNSGHAASADRLEELTAAHIHRLTADVQRTIHRADYVKRRLAHQYDRVDQALSDEIEYRVNRAVRLALKDIKDRVDVLDGHNSPRAQNNQANITTLRTVSRRALRVTFRCVSQAVLRSSLGVLRFGRRRVSAALGHRKPVTLASGRKYAMPGQWKECTPPL